MTRGDLLAATPEESCLQADLDEALKEISLLRGLLAAADRAIGLVDSFLEQSQPELARWHTKKYLGLKAQKEKVSG